MKAFVSYSWDDDSHKEWVRKFGDTLIENGIDVVLDQYDLKYGQDRFAFMEELRGVDAVLCICTPQYVDKANQRKDGVGEETKYITPQFFKENRDKEFIPIIRSSRKNLDPVPDYMSALIYLDFRNDEAFEANIEKLLRHLYKKPIFSKPILGEMPNFSRLSENSISVGSSDLESLYLKYIIEFPKGESDPDYLINLGRICFYLNKDDEAEKLFNRILELDSSFTSFAELDNEIKSNPEHEIKININTRRALVYIGVIKGDEDYVLDGAYHSDDPETLIVAGKYYLQIHDAEISTAIAYFIKATRNEDIASSWVQECDESLEWFTSTRLHYYPLFSMGYIKELIGKWDEYKTKLRFVNKLELDEYIEKALR